MRKVIQLVHSMAYPTAVPGSNDFNVDTERLYALCDDGSMWTYYARNGWKRIRDIPLESP